MKYKIVVDYGKPYEIEAGTEAQLKTELWNLYTLQQTGDYGYFDLWVYSVNEQGEELEITESQLIEEIIAEIIEGKAGLKEERLKTEEWLKVMDEKMRELK